MKSCQGQDIFPLFFKFTLILFHVFSISFFSYSSSVFAGEEISAKEIAQKVFDRDKGNNSRAKALMVLINKKGDKRTREFATLKIKEGELERQLIRFLAPADIRGTGFLTIEKKGWETDQFLYLPALRRTRRIVSSQKSHSFVNSDFSYEDMERHPVDNYEYIMQPETIVNNLSCYVIEAKPKKDVDSQYSMIKNYIAKDSFVTLVSMFFDDKKKLIKQYKVMKLEKIQNIWTESTVIMEDLRKNHKTYIKLQEIKYNTDITVDALSQQALENF